MEGRYSSNLSKSTLLKAHEELNEPLDNAERLEAIDKFRNYFFEKYPETKLSDRQQQDDFLLRFLRVKKFNNERAASILLNYINRKSIIPEIFERIENPQKVSEIVDTKYITALPGHAKNGSAVLLVRPAFGCDKPNIYDIFAGIFMSMEKLIDKEENQINGITMIEDLSYVNMHLVNQMGPLIAKKLVSIVQDTLPIRLKNVCFLNEWQIFDLIFAIIKPFLSEKIRKRIILIGNDFEKLHVVVDPVYLPSTYGGKVDENDLNHESWKSALLGKATAL